MHGNGDALFNIIAGALSSTLPYVHDNDIIFMGANI